ncbi:unnamed protein product, partial [Meganyctiphanes norvegica]
METKNNCEVCSNPAKQFCSSCKAVFYCSKECQKQDWKIHKGKCKPFTVQNHALYGRYLVASREIKQGEILMKEPVTLLGPRNRTVPVCLGCHKKITGSYKCSKCQFPMCASYCEVSQNHKAECALLSKVAGRIKINDFDSPSPAYECITPLRVLLKKESAPDKWKSINSLQSNEKALNKSSHMYAIKNNTVNFIREFVGWKEASEEDIIRACGILITNAIELEHNGQKVRGLYPMAAMMAHDCVPNTKHVFDDDLNMIVRATTAIPKGEAITMTYTDTLHHSLSRRKNLMSSKFVNCLCKRCSDKTELGTNLSTLLCVDCQNHVKSVDPLDPDARWSCDKCQHTIRGKDVRWGDNALYKELRNLDNTSVQPLEEFVDAYKKTLHPQHRFLVEGKYGLIKLYGTVIRYCDMSREQLESKVKYCRELLKIASAIAPGMSLLRGTLLFELQAGLVAVAKYLISNELVSKDQAQEYMTEAMKHLQEATVILKHEPEMEKGGIDQMLKKLQDELDM